MRHRHYDQLRNFCIVARHDSFTRAAETLNLTKGAICHQIDALEGELGFKVFNRRRSGIELTANGARLLRVADLSFASVEQEIAHLRRRDQSSITIGMATYFASRWLSPRLMHFITRYPGIGLRIQPVVGNPDLQASDLDMAIRWGKGNWDEPGLRIEKIFACPAQLTANPATGRRIEDQGIEARIAALHFLHDADGSEAWADWFEAAGLEMPRENDELMIPDPNVRVQAVIDGQGVALYDALVDDEIKAGRLYQYSAVELDEYGYYLVYPADITPESPLAVFRDWLLQEAQLG